MEYPRNLFSVYTLAFLFAFIVAALFTFQACDSISSEGDGGSSPTTPTPTIAGMVIGRVQTGNSSLNSSLSNLGGVVVAIVGRQHTTTNNDGRFAFSAVSPGTRIIISFSKDNYVSTTEIIDVVAGQTTFVNVVLSEIGISGSLDETGGSLEIGEASISFSSNALLGGITTVEATYFNPSTDYFVDTYSGDFTGRSTAGTEVALESFGFMNVNLKNDRGFPTHLREGQTATLSVPVPSGMSNPPASIPLWYYNETEGIWIEEGSATLTRNQYVGVVTHFTSWSLDTPYDISYITGRVINNDGTPINHAYIKIDGVDYTGRSEIFTGTDGIFNIGVKSNSTIIITTSKGGVISEPLTVNPTASIGAEQNIGDIILTAPWATATLTWGDLPRDLDCHLIVPNSSGSGNSGYHIYYGSGGSLTSYPYAKLDFDYQFGYGPENISVVRKYEGTYQYYIYLYTTFGDGTIQSSGAIVTLSLDGDLYTFNAPTSGSTDHRYWHVFDMDVDGSGNVSLNNINTMQGAAPSSTGLLLKAHPQKNISNR